MLMAESAILEILIIVNFLPACPDAILQGKEVYARKTSGKTIICNVYD